jgi:hypothetical protein
MIPRQSTFFLLTAAICRSTSVSQGLAAFRQNYRDPLRNPAGEIVGVNVATEEITERKRAEAVFAANEKALRQSVERQTATANILQVIASSPSDVRPLPAQAAADLPGRQSTCPALSRKIICFPLRPNHRLTRRIPSRMRGVSRSSRTLGTGCGGRGSVVAPFGADERRSCGRRSRVVLTLRSRRQVF